MGFELSIWNANRSTLLNRITSITPSGIKGGFKWQRKGNGDCVQLDLAGRNDRIELAPRSVVGLKIDGTPHFWGIVPDPPSAASPDEEGAQVLGGREALRKVLMDGRVYRDQGVFAIVRDLLSRLCPPSLIYDAALVGWGSGTDGGPTLGTYYAPTSKLEAALDGLAKSAGVDWGVDHEGRVFFGRPAPAPFEVAYSGHGWRRLRVQGREAVTQAVLRLVSAPTEGVAGATWLADGRLLDYLPATLTKVAESPTHPLYLAQAAFDVPEGVSVSREQRKGTVRSVGINNPELAFDADTNTAASSSTTLPSLDLESGERVIGVRVRYRLSGGQQLSGQVRVFHDATANGLGSYDDLRVDLPPSDSPRDLIVIAPPSAALAALGVKRSWARVEVWRAPGGATDVLSVYDLALLVIDEAAAQRTAESFLQTPFASPAELTLSGLTQPRPTVTVRDSPDGDVTGPADLWEYEHSPERPRTLRVRLGSDGQSDTARAIKFAVRGGG